MDITSVLRDILVVLVAAKIAAELAERAGIPAVVGEIVAGILIGPSLLGLVGSDDVLRTLGEIGVILLLVDVGLEMDLAELGKVGRSSLLVAIVGVITPMALGFGAMELIGNDFNTSLFVGAALTATSVGITARVFGDLRALASVEARTVLGAAVADDVMGLVVLTVVVRIVTEGSVSILSVAGIIAVAVAFLVVGGLVGLRVAPPLFAMVERASRSTGTMVAIALAFTLAFAELASAAKLAPIVGAFVAGIALSRSEQSNRVRRELTPVGHLFIPVFFLQIGIDADIGAFASGAVIRDAAVLLVVAVIGKLVSPIGAVGSPGDKALIGLGMLPRGEVGLIFATIGLQNGVLDRDLYAALLLVVLITTLVTPQLLKIRYGQVRGTRRPEAIAADAPPPPGGWLVAEGGVVDLRATPPAERALPIALESALTARRERLGDRLLDWLSGLPDGPLAWDAESLHLLLEVVERGNALSWRFLQVSGVLDRALPELAAGFSTRGGPFDIDPLGPYRLIAPERLRSLDPGDPVALETRALENVDVVLLADLIVEGLEDRRDIVAEGTRLLARLPLDGDVRRHVLELVEDRDLLWSAARQPGGLGEEAVLQLASHLVASSRASALYVLSALRDDRHERWEVARLKQLYELVQSVLSDPELSGSEARSVVDLRRAQAAALVGDDDAARRRIERAPRSYVLRQGVDAIARHVRLAEPPPTGADVRVGVATGPDGRGYWVDVAAADRPGLLASITGGLAAADADVSEAVITTWDDGLAMETFRVDGRAAPDAGRLREAIREVARADMVGAAVPDAEVTFDQVCSPWHTVCEVRAPDRPGLLHALATAFAAADVEVLAATVTSDDQLVIDRFEVTDRSGAKLTAKAEDAVRHFVRAGVRARPRRFRRGLSVR